MINIERIRELAQAAGLNLSQLESKAGLANGTVGKWKDSSPRIDNLLKVAEVLGCSINELTN